MFDSSFELLPPAALRRFQHFQSMKITDRRMIEPAAAPITTPIISPRELAMELFEAARVDAEVSIALLGDVGDVVVDANKDGGRARCSRRRGRTACSRECRCYACRQSNCCGKCENCTLRISTRIGVRSSQVLGAATQNVFVVSVLRGTEGKIGVRARDVQLA